MSSLEALGADLRAGLRRSLSDVEPPEGLLAGVRARRAREHRRRVLSATSGGVGAVAVVAGVVLVAASSAPPTGGVARLAASPSVRAPQPVTTGAGTTPSALDPHAPPTLHLPSIHVTAPIAAGTVERNVPGQDVDRFAGTLCGAGGTAIYGRRTTFARPFYRLDRVRRGDVATTYGAGVACTYTAFSTVVLSDGALPALVPGTLQLVADTPLGSSRDRLVVTFRRQP